MGLLKNILIKFIVLILFFIGLIFKRKRYINPKEIRTILVNRTDRIGDAVITLPLLLELNKFFDITVLTSRYNDPILNKFFKTKITIKDPILVKDVVKIVFRSLVKFPYNLKSNFKYDLYLDLMGLRGLDIFLDIKSKGLCKYYINLNLGPWNLLLDYNYKGFLGLFSKKHILDTFKEILYFSLGIDLDIKDYVDLSNLAKNPIDFDIDSPFILINISGSNRFRGPRPEVFAGIVNKINFDGVILIMDEPNFPNIERFKNNIKKPNVVYLNRNYDIFELLYIANKSKLYIGSDSGISQLLQVPVSCVLFFGNPPPSCWRPYSKNPYIKRKIKKLIIEETITTKSLIKKVIYIPIWCRPCLDIGCNKPICIDIFSKYIDFITKEINNILDKN